LDKSPVRSQKKGGRNDDDDRGEADGGIKGWKRENEK
jgi:hypothetical protein